MGCLALQCLLKKFEILAGLPPQNCFVPARPPHYFQATESSCVPACLRMVLVASLGHEVPEITLRQLCECDDEGTTKSKAVDCAKHYGFVELFSAYLHLEELEAE